MLNPQLIINTPTANGTAARNDAASSSSNGATNDSFGNVLARHMGEQAQPAKSATTQNDKTAQSSDANSKSSQDSSSSQPTTDATSVALASLHGSAKKATSTTKEQDKTSATDTATLVAGMFGNQSAMSSVVNNAGAGGKVGIDPVINQKRITGTDPTAGNRVGIDPVTGNGRKIGANPVTGIKGAVGVNPVGNSGMAGIDPVTAHGGMIGIDSAAGKNASAKVAGAEAKTGTTSAITAKNTAKTPPTADGAAAHKSAQGTARENMPLTAPLKTETVLQSPLKVSSESVKSHELTSANTAPSAPTVAEAGNIPIVAGAPSANAANAGNVGNNTITAPLTSNAWPAEFAQKITWVSTQQNQVAELHLNPPDLGPMSVVLSISDNQATAVFSSPHSAVREAIENAMPKLRDSMAENGIMLGNATVNDQAPRDNGAYNDMNQRSAPRISPQSDASATVTAPTSLPPRPASRHNGMVDTFA